MRRKLKKGILLSEFRTYNALMLNRVVVVVALDGGSVFDSTVISEACLGSEWRGVGKMKNWFQIGKWQRGATDSDADIIKPNFAVVIQWKHFSTEKVSIFEDKLSNNVFLK